MPRGAAVWKGRVTFGLVGIPVALVPAVDAKEHIGFHLLHRKDRAPIEYRKFCSKEGRPVPDDEVVRGHEVSKGKWALVEKEEVESARKAAGAEVEAHVLEVLQFVRPEELDPVSFAQPYHLVPDEGGRKPFAVLKAALASAGRVGLGRIRLRATPRLAAILASKRGLSVILLRPFEELAAAPALTLPAPQPGETKMARLLIDEMSREGLEPEKYPDRYRSVLKKLLSAKRPAGAAAEAAREAPQAEGEVVDLMSALEASLARRGGRTGRGRPRAA
jgi:DNA end-binding protein Ku